MQRAQRAWRGAHETAMRCQREWSNITFAYYANVTRQSYFSEWRPSYQFPDSQIILLGPSVPYSPASDNCTRIVSARLIRGVAQRHAYCSASVCPLTSPPPPSMLQAPWCQANVLPISANGTVDQVSPPSQSAYNDRKEWTERHRLRYACVVTSRVYADVFSEVGMRAARWPTWPVRVWRVRC